MFEKLKKFFVEKKNAIIKLILCLIIFIISISLFGWNQFSFYIFKNWIITHSSFCTLIILIVNIFQDYMPSDEEKFVKGFFNFTSVLVLIYTGTNQVLLWFNFDLQTQIFDIMFHGTWSWWVSVLSWILGFFAIQILIAIIGMIIMPIYETIQNQKQKNILKKEQKERGKTKPKFKYGSYVYPQYLRGMSTSESLLVNESIKKDICPNCHNKLKKRKRHSDGQQFIGCEGFHIIRCTFIISLYDYLNLKK